MKQGDPARFALRKFRITEIDTPEIGIDQKFAARRSAKQRSASLSSGLVSAFRSLY